ncbi:MAG: isopentenyl-diphosphate Delta-isomerase [Clostridiales bacterium]|nr:isopentenyl-diphosphate Delta-isomerase [Clostridiales bacterium]
MRIRADMEDLLVWVDEDDHEIGSGEKMDTHIRGQLHRAFSVFFFRESDGKLLIHRRAEGKYHSGGLWTNSCCSHPRKGEDLFDAVIRRMREELGFPLPDDRAEAAAGAYGGLRELGCFQYYQKYEDCAEHEIDHVFCLTVPDAQITLSPDPEEIGEIQWISIDDLLVWMERRPEDFTAWFAPALEIVREFME